MSVSTQEQTVPDTSYVPIVLQFPPVLGLSEEQFFDLCEANRDLHIERNENGKLIIMPLTGGESSRRNAQIAIQLGNWAERDGRGVTFDSSGGFRLPNSAIRSPDAAWLPLTRWNALTAEQRKKFVPLCPDFVLELRSASDSLAVLQDKMQEYVANGAEMGLLIDPEEKRVHVYQRDHDAQILEDPKTVACDPVLPGFVLDLRKIW